MWGQSGKCAHMRKNLRKLLPVASSNICGTRGNILYFVLLAMHSDLNSHSKAQHFQHILNTLEALKPKNAFPTLSNVGSLVLLSILCYQSKWLS